MEKTPLHAQKVTILSRLIKESSLTLEEALLLLKEEEEPEQGPVYNPSTSTPWTVTNPYIYPGGTISFSSGSSGILSTYNPSISNQTETDLNN